MRHVKRRQVIWSESPVDLGPGNLHDHLVGQTQVMEEDRGPRIVVEAELDGRKHILRPALADEERPGVTGRLDSEALRAHEFDAALDRVYPEPGPGELAERQARNDLELDGGLAAEQLDGAFRNCRRAGDRVGDPAVLGGRSHHDLDDRPVHLVEGGALLVAVVQAENVR